MFAGYHSLLDVDYVVLETSGQISVIPKAEQKTVTISDMKLIPEYTGYTRVIIMDGVLIKANLIELGYNETWLANQLKKYHLNMENTLLLTADEAGNVFCQEREKK